MNTALGDQGISHGQNIPESSPSETNSLKGSKPDKQIPVLDGARAIACLIVLSFHVNLFARHYGIWLPLHSAPKLTVIFALNEYLGDYFADSGAVLFFVLSGFLLFLPYAKALLFDSPWPSIRRFYLRRIFRILPGYYAALFLITLFFHPEFLRYNHWHDLWLFLTFRMDYSLSQKLNSPFWTLAIEFQFYLLLPIIAWLLRPMVRRGTVGWRMLKLTFWLLIMTAWGLLTRYWGLFIANTPKLDFLIPHSISTRLISFIYGDRGKYFEVFAVGMLLCMVYTYTQNSPLAEHWSIRMRRLSWPMFTSGLVLIFFLSLWHFYTVDITSNYAEYHLVIKTPFDSYASIIVACWSQWEVMAYAIGYGLCLWALLYGSPKLKRPFEWSILRWVGMISFSLYMWHFPFIGLFFASLINYSIRQQGLGPLVQYSILWCWVLIVIIPISAMLYHWIELPGMRLGERLVRKLER